MWSVSLILLVLSFPESVALVVVTGVVSGIIIPLMVSWIQKRKTNNELIAQAKAKLFDDATNTIFTLQSLLLDISYYRSYSGKNQDMFLKAFDRYCEKSPDLIAKWRSLTAKANHLASKNISDQMQESLTYLFKEQDKEIIRLYSIEDAEQWKQLHQTNIKALTETELLINNIAKDLGITKKDFR